MFLTLFLPLLLGILLLQLRLLLLDPADIPASPDKRPAFPANKSVSVSTTKPTSVSTPTSANKPAYKPTSTTACPAQPAFNTASSSKVATKHSVTTESNSDYICVQNILNHMIFTNNLLNTLN
jgi:hypothetical protein